MSNTLANFDNDIASLMLTALTEEKKQEEVETVTISVEEQMMYLRKHIDTLSVPDRKSIGDILVMNNERDKIKRCGEGTSINLNSLPDNVVTQMYNLMNYILSKRS